MTNFNSIPSAFFSTAEKYLQNPLLRYRNKEVVKETLTFKQVCQRVNVLAYAFEVYGASKKHIAIFSENRAEWFLTDMALLSIGAVDIPRGNDSTTEELQYILEHSDAYAVIVENKYMYEKIKEHTKKMHFILVLDSSIHEPKNKIYAYENFFEEGQAIAKDDDFAKKEAAKLTRETMATIIYTSGTTGRPKGVVLNHGNILHNIEVLPPIIELKAGEKFLSVLPIWHIYERMVSYLAAVVGCFTAITSKRDLKVDMAEEKPDLLISVPAIWVNIYNGIMKAIEKKSFIAKNLAKFLIKHSVSYTRHKRYLNDEVYLFGDDKKENHALDYKSGLCDKFFHSLAKKIVYKNIIALTGGRLRLTISGGGALPMYIEDFLEAAGITLVVGWGITETSPVVTLRSHKENIRGTCGKPAPRLEIEVRDKDTNEKVEDGVMGVCFIKGDNVFTEYYKDKELTEQVKVDGYFNSGDLGAYTQNGHIVLTGRAKETIVLLTGENVEPQPIENKILESNYILQAVLFGQDKATVGAIIVLDSENIKEYLVKHKIECSDFPTCPDVIKLIKNEIEMRVNAKNGFRPYEIVSKIIIITEQFTLENGMLTQSLKIKRNVVMEKFKNDIENVYTNL